MISEDHKHDNFLVDQLNIQLLETSYVTTLNELKKKMESENILKGNSQDLL